jgi:NAD(P)-dependent dehydrogenase (short-subunit alcohol dehydrogenase family)
VTLLGRRRTALEELAADLGTPGPDVEVVVADLADGAGPGLPTPWAEDRLLLVNAAAVHGPLGPLAGIDADAWARTVQVNLTALVRLVSAVVPLMLDRGWGRVVQVSSAAAVAPPGRFNSAYAVSKAAANRMLAQLAVEVGGSGVTVHAVHPGEIVSAMWADIDRQSQDRPELADFAQWAIRTAARPDDPDRFSAWVVGLLDDTVAKRHHARFSWPQQPDRPDIALG